MWTKNSDTECARVLDPSSKKTITANLYKSIVALTHGHANAAIFKKMQGEKPLGQVKDLYFVDLMCWIYKNKKNVQHNTN